LAQILLGVFVGMYSDQRVLYLTSQTLYQVLRLAFCSEKEDLAASAAAEPYQFRSLQRFPIDKDPRPEPESACAARFLVKDAANLKCRRPDLYSVAYPQSQSFEKRSGDHRAVLGKKRIVEWLAVC